MTTLIGPEAAATTTPSTAASGLTFAQAGAMWLDYLLSYRNCSAQSVEGYRTDLRCFQEFLSERMGQIVAVKWR